jgi:hypothetical protein
MPDETYLELALREFRRYKRLADKAIEQVPDGCLFTSPGEGDNCVAVIMKHLSGNMLSRWLDFLTTDGEKTDRNRDMEFTLTEKDSRPHLLSEWEKGWETLFNALTPLSANDLGKTVMIRGEAFTVLQAIGRQLTHYAYHVGQIVFLAKHFAGDRWKSLSVPKGESANFNKDPRKYL